MADTTTRAEPEGPDDPATLAPRRLWSARVVGAVAAVVLLVVLLVFGVQLLDRSEFGSTTYPGPIDRVDIRLARGDITLVAAPEGTDSLLVERTMRWRFSKPRADTNVDPDSGRARIEADCPRVVLFIGTCTVDYVVQVPSGVRVNARTDSGTVTAEGIDGWVRAVTDGGEVIGTDLLSAEFLVDSEGGDVALGFLDPPSRVEVVSGGGSVTVLAPDGPYAVRTAFGPEELEVDVPRDREAERTITIDSSGGAIEVSPP